MPATIPIARMARSYSLLRAPALRGVAIHR